MAFTHDVFLSYSCSGQGGRAGSRRSPARSRAARLARRLGDPARGLHPRAGSRRAWRAPRSSCCACRERALRFRLGGLWRARRSGSATRATATAGSSRCGSTTRDAEAVRRPVSGDATGVDAATTEFEQAGGACLPCRRSAGGRRRGAARRAGREPSLLATPTACGRVALSPRRQRALSGVATTDGARLGPRHRDLRARPRRPHRRGVVRSAYHPDGTHALSGGGDRTVRVWDLATGACKRVLEGHTNGVWCGRRFTPTARTPSAAPTTRRCASGTSPPAPASASWKATPRAVRSASRMHPTARTPSAAAATARCASGTSPPAPASASWKATPTCVWSASRITPTEPAPSAAARDDGTVRVWDLATGACERVLEGHTAGVNSASPYHPDGAHALSARRRPHGARLGPRQRRPASASSEGHTERR